jgi:hypothetical protein
LVPVPGVGKIWPYTDRNYSRVPTDPISLAFRGKDTDPRLIRQILMGLPPNPVLGCQWKDAIGRPQTTYSKNARWQGSAIQLECGEYSTIRLHLRLFRHGPYTLGGAHLEVQIPGTTEHVVLSWVHARELVLADLERSGHFFHDPRAVPGITAAPSWRTIDQGVYNLLVPALPPPLRAFLQLPPPPLDGDFHIPNDGVVQVVTLWGQFDPVDDEVVVEFDHVWGMTIPKPFCANGEYVHVVGPLHMVHRVKTDRHGTYFSSFRASGTLWIQPVPQGNPYQASVSEVFRSYISDRSQSVFMKSRQVLHSDPEQWVFEALWAGRRNVYLARESCGY